MVVLPIIQLIFFMITLSSTVLACPDRCQCFGNTKTVVCANSFIASIETHKIPKDTRKLDLAGNLLKEIHMTDFRGLYELEELHLNDNNINSIEDESFLDLGNLTLLVLNKNSLQEITEQTFRGLKKLRNLWMNDIHQGHEEISIADKAFMKLTNLESLMINGNTMGYVSDQTFLGLSSLKSFSISLEKILLLSSGAFDTMSSAVYVQSTAEIGICCCDSAKALDHFISFPTNKCFIDNCNDENFACKRNIDTSLVILKPLSTSMAIIQHSSSITSQPRQLESVNSIASIQPKSSTLLLQASVTSITSSSNLQDSTTLINYSTSATPYISIIMSSVQSISTSYPKYSSTTNPPLKHSTSTTSSSLYKTSSGIKPSPSGYVAPPVYTSVSLKNNSATGPILKTDNTQSGGTIVTISMTFLVSIIFVVIFFLLN